MRQVQLVQEGKDISTIEEVKGVIKRFWEEDHVLVRMRVEPLFLCPGF